MLKDVRYGLRMLLKSPGLTIIAVLTLGLGIGANTLVFSGVYALLLQALPYPNSDRLALISQANKSGDEFGVSYPDFTDWKTNNTVFEQMAASRQTNVNLDAGEPVERVTARMISREFFPLLDGRAALGRTFVSEEFGPGGEKSVVLSHGFWQRRFGGDVNVIGRQLRLDDEAATVIGVMPPAFQYVFGAALWMPIPGTEEAKPFDNASANLYELVVVLKPSVTPEHAAQELSILSQRSARQLEGSQQELSITVRRLRDAIGGIDKWRTPVLVLQFAVIFVLLIACVNLANLLLARNADRRQEFTIRLALGAGRRRIIRQLLTETLLLGLSGSLLGLLLAAWGLKALRPLIPPRISALSEIGISPPILLVTLGVSLFTSLAFGLVPALLASRPDLHGSLRSGAGNTTLDPRARRLSWTLVAAEVALAVVLLASSGLMIRTFLNLTIAEPGFEPEHAMAISVSLPAAQYVEYDSVASYFDEAINRIKALPGVESTGAVSYLPLIGYNPGVDFRIAGREENRAAYRADLQPVSADYFQAMRIPLLKGQPFTGSAMKASPEVVIINNALARKFWPDEDPLGKFILLKGNPVADKPLAVIGVVGDVRQFGLHTDPRPEIYLPMYRGSMTLIVRGSGDLAGALREMIERLDSRAAIRLNTMQQVVADSIEKRRIFAIMLGVLAATALLLATLGIYGVISYVVAQRTREIGIRMALGAQPRTIHGMVLGEGAKVVAVGAASGLLLAYAATRLLARLLYGVSATDSVTFAGVTVLLVVAALLASLFPARRAAKVDPIAALRNE